MAPLHIYYVLEHAFNLWIPSRSIPKNIINILSKFKCDYENLFPTSNHLGLFNFQCQHLKVYTENEICGLFTLTFEGRIKSWYKAIPAKSIHNWKQFMETFLIPHHDYDCDELHD